METELDKLTQELAKEIERLAQMVLKENGIGEGTKLYDDLKVEIDSMEDGIVLSSFFNSYLSYIENGRKPKTGKKPPIEALKSWAVSKGIPADNNTLYAISYAIWRDGIAPRPILAMLEERVEEYINNEFANKLNEAIVAELETRFNLLEVKN